VVLVLLTGLAGCQKPQPVGPATAPPPLSPTAAAASPAAPPPPRALNLTAVGDIMLDRSVEKIIKQTSCKWVIQGVAADLAAADLAFANLESPLSTVGYHDPPDCAFRANPAYIKVLTLAGIDLVSFANNHCTDPGREGYLQTLQHLDDAGIKYVGAARNRAQASWLRIMTVNGLKIGFLAYTDLDFPVGCPSRVPSDLSKHREQIAAAKNKCDLLIVSYHWGQEYWDHPCDRQKKVGHAAIEAGADAILGHHPHVLEGIEAYRGHPILYSMGNFIFDMRQGPKMESAIFKLRYLEGKGWTVKVVPVYLPPNRMGPEYPPAEKRDAILRRFAGYCKALGTTTQTEQGALIVQAAAPTPGEPHTSSP
jgi:poly-gamma-glutamate synthesis protein (capsule biosynthesis protein)